MTICRLGRYFHQKKKNFIQVTSAVGKGVQQSEGICVNYIVQHLFSLDFLPNWEDKKMWAGRDYFPPHFLSLLFSLLNQIRENVIFYPMFLSLFSSSYFPSFLFSSQPNIPLRFLPLGFKGIC